MNRPIKFRVWDIKEKKFIRFGPSPQPFLSYDGKHFEVVGDWDNIKEKDFVLQQFTGLKDKNGKEIYEGDIIQIPDIEVEGSIRSPYGHVWYSDISAHWLISYNHQYSEVCGELYRRTHDSEIVGNIFENPELTK